MNKQELRQKLFLFRISNTKPSILVFAPEPAPLSASACQSSAPWPKKRQKPTMKKLLLDPFDEYQEEKMIHGLVIAYAKIDEDTRRRLLDDFLPAIDSWAVCDCVANTLKSVPKDAEAYFNYALSKLASPQPFTIRFGVVLLLCYFVCDTYIDRTLSALSDIPGGSYYVEMGVAWALSVCYVKFPEKTWSLLEKDCLPASIQKLTVRKIIESNRVSPDEKAVLRKRLGSSHR